MKNAFAVRIHCHRFHDLDDDLPDRKIAELRVVARGDKPRRQSPVLHSLIASS
jgi:hypothetical protein